jgi:hypothetical protein
VAPYSFAWRHAIPLVFVIALISASASFLIWPWLAIVALATIAVPYLALALKASSVQAKRYGKRLFPFLPIAFWLYHVMYGFGGLRGILRLLLGGSPVQSVREPWKGAGSFRAWTAISPRSE